MSVCTRESTTFFTIFSTRYLEKKKSCKARKKEKKKKKSVGSTIIGGCTRKLTRICQIMPTSKQVDAEIESLFLFINAGSPHDGTLQKVYLHFRLLLC
jgi:hypothetical protein